jgi:hypothetical protein
MAGETSQAFSSNRGECILLNNDAEDSENKSVRIEERSDRLENDSEVVRNLTQKKDKSVDRNRSSAKIRDMQSESNSHSDSDSDNTSRRSVSRKRKRTKKHKKDKKLKHKRRKRSESDEREHVSRDVSPLSYAPLLSEVEDDHHEDEDEEDYLSEIEREYLKDEEKGPEVREKMASLLCLMKICDISRKMHSFKAVRVL